MVYEGDTDSTGVDTTQATPEMVYDKDKYTAVFQIFDNSKRTNKQTMTAQRILNQYGFGLEEDGFYGPKTDKAVKKFVGDYSLEYMWDAMKTKVGSIFK